MDACSGQWSQTTINISQAFENITIRTNSDWTTIRYNFQSSLPFEAKRIALGNHYQKAPAWIIYIEPPALAA
jgi:hypothetical protein